MKAWSKPRDLGEHYIYIRYFYLPEAPCTAQLIALCSLRWSLKPCSFAYHYPLWQQSYLIIQTVLQLPRRQKLRLQLSPWKLSGAKRHTFSIAIARDIMCLCVTTKCVNGNFCVLYSWGSKSFFIQTSSIIYNAFMFPWPGVLHCAVGRERQFSLPYLELVQWASAWGLSTFFQKSEYSFLREHISSPSLKHRDFYHLLTAVKYWEREPV